MDGLLVIDKPSGITSRDAVNRLQRVLPPRIRIGHTGTLDPLATGVLVVCIGRATRLAEYVQAMDKVYETTLVLGARSDTDDADGDITPTPGAMPVDEATIRSALARFIGAIEQTPPAYSAVKVGGRRAHDLARRGREVEIAPRTVHIYDISIRGYAWPKLRLEIHCGKGTYIRSLARDLGEALGCGAHVKDLRRTRVGPFRADGALTTDAKTDDVQAALLPVSAAVAQLPSMTATEEQVARLRHGQPIELPAEVVEGLMAVVDQSGGLVGIARPREGLLWPEKIFAVP